MTWNPAWIAFMPQVAASDITAPIVAVAVVVVVLGVLAALLLQPQQKPVQPQRVFRVKI
jgi:FlaG/FlaF family flagellin (archaellin)